MEECGILKSISFILLGITLTLDCTQAGRHHNTDDKEMFYKGNFAEEQPYTYVSLSPWEMHVVNDLLIELMLLKCQNVNRTVARGMKTFITSRVTKAPRVETMDPHFFPVYTNLVKCMDYLDKRMEKVVPEEKPSKFESHTEPAEPITYDVPYSTEPPTSAPVLVEDELAKVQASSLALAQENREKLMKEHVIIFSLSFDANKYAKNNANKGKAVFHIENYSNTKPETGNKEEKNIHMENDETNTWELILPSPSDSGLKDEGQTNFQVRNGRNIRPGVEHQKETRKNGYREDDLDISEKDDDKTVLESASDLLSKIWNRTTTWLSSLGREKRSVGVADMLPKKKYSKKWAKHGNLQSLAKKQVLHKFKEVLETLARLASRSCPSKPNHSFTRRAIEDIIYWISTDFDSALDAYEKYFLQAYLGLEIQQCLVNEFH